MPRRHISTLLNLSESNPSHQTSPPARLKCRGGMINHLGHFEAVRGAFTTATATGQSMRAPPAGTLSGRSLRG